MNTYTTADLDRAKAILAHHSFKHFIEYFWGTASQDGFVSGYHVDALAEHLQAVAKGQIKRLCINLAIRHSKSLICSVLFPAWVWLRDPTTRIISASYSKELTVRDSVRTRQVLESELFQKLYPGVVTFEGEQTKRQDRYQNDAKGERLSVSIGSRTAGFDADLVVCDDIHDFATRNSLAERSSAIDYFEKALTSRLVYTGREGIVLAGHRVHDDDVYSRIRATYGDDGTWTYLVLPEEFTSKYRGWFNGIDWQDKRSDGELLWPERFSADQLAQEKRKYRHEYSAIFQQEPTPPEGSLFKSEWFRHWSSEGDDYLLGSKRYKKDKAWRFGTCDTAISTSSTADWTVCQIWDVCNGHLILVDQLRKRLDGVQIVPALTAFYQLHRPQFISVEQEFVGKFVIDQLTQANVCVKPFSAKRHGDKETRAIAAEILMEAGRVWFPSAPFVAELQAEVLGFPYSSHDDQVDCLSAAAVLAEKYVGKPVDDTPPDPEAEKAKAEAAERERFNRVLWAGAPF